MKKTQFIFCIHNHQPVGNFEHVFKKAFSTTYKPFLAILQKYPSVKAGLHYSGPLLEWMESKQPDVFDILQTLIEKKQVELLSGGFYEPIFSILRERDVLGQIEMMNRFLREKFNTVPRGAWLAERVWDPVLPRLMSDSHLSYTLLDSTHFLHTGIPSEQIRGYYMTEREGKTLAVFPIDMNLRYTIPFEPPEKTIEYLRYMASDVEDVAITYGDDGEKFGMWPGTYTWVYEKGWLEAFFSELEKNQDMIIMTTFSEYLASHNPEGRIYLPTLSYEEMMEWALPAAAVTLHEDMVENLQNLQLKDKYRSFIGGGYWNNFLVKYPESNLMHKKMLMVSEKLEAWEPTAHNAGENSRVDSAKEELYKAQCNCPYWHGLFGGVYLNYLRHSVYEHLINAENIIDGSSHGDTPWIEYSVTDFKRDNSEDILISGQPFNAYFSPKDGGGLFELDVRPRSFNLSNTLTRRMEGYHRKLKIEEKQPVDSIAEGQPVSIHNITKVKDQTLQSQLTYDWYQRYSFIDHFLGEGTAPEPFFLARYPEVGNFVNMPYTIEEIRKDASDKAVTFVLSRQGSIIRNGKQMPITIKKSISVDNGSGEITALYSLTNRSPMMLDVWFGVELNVTLLAGTDPLRYYRFSGTGNDKFPMNFKGDIPEFTSLDIMDDWNGFGITLSVSPESSLWTFPLETISQSEDGLEKTYQGSTLLLHWKTSLEQDIEQKKSIALTLKTFTGENRKFLKEAQLCRN